MRQTCGRVLWICGFLGVLVTQGCLRRKESVQVSADGTVTIQLEYSGKEDVWNTLDALPSEQAGWKLATTTEKKDGEEQKVVRSVRRFSADERLPGTFAAPNDDHRDLVLHFPTTVQREKRGTNTYYHFRRVYAPRTWAYIQIWHDQTFDEDVKKIAEKDLGELSREDRARLVGAFAEFESAKQVEFAKTAWEYAFPTAPQDHWLLARRALLDSYEEIDYEKIVNLIEDAPSDQRDGLLAAEADRILRRGLERMIDSARRLGHDDEKLAGFRREIDRAKRAYDITDQLGGQIFEIEVQMPGRIVAHNADKSDGDGAVTWEFSGEAFRDRPHEILVTSCVEGGEDRK